MPCHYLPGVYAGYMRRARARYLETAVPVYVLCILGDKSRSQGPVKAEWRGT